MGWKNKKGMRGRGLRAFKRGGWVSVLSVCVFIWLSKQTHKWNLSTNRKGCFGVNLSRERCEEQKQKTISLLTTSVIESGERRREKAS